MASIVADTHGDPKPGVSNNGTLSQHWIKSVGDEHPTYPLGFQLLIELGLSLMQLAEAINLLLIFPPDLRITPGSLILLRKLNMPSALRLNEPEGEVYCRLNDVIRSYGMMNGIGELVIDTYHSTLEHDGLCL